MKKSIKQRVEVISYFSLVREIEKMKRKKLSVLILCDKFINSASTINDHINALMDSRHNVFAIHCREKIPDFVHFDWFDVVIIHYTIIVSSCNYLPLETSERIKKFNGLKACFIQDEYRFVNKTVDALKNLGIHVLFTCVRLDEIEKVYPRSALPDLRTVSVLTGYVPEKLKTAKVLSYEDREIDVSYRGRALPFWLGELGQEKINIAKKFKRDAESWGLKVDIDYREEARIYHEAWIKFLINSKACLGVESGASVFDFSGEVERNVCRHLQQNPDDTFENVKNLYFVDLEGKIKLNQISPRCFEAACLRTLMILYEGEYSGILIPWRHYVPLKKDHSNMKEVISVIRNKKRAKSIISKAYQEVALNPAFSYSSLTNIFDATLEQEFEKNKIIPSRIFRVILNVVICFANCYIRVFCLCRKIYSAFFGFSAKQYNFCKKLCMRIFVEKGLKIICSDKRIKD
ncbi:MAG: hypothetical protein K1X28_05240 [Parachlamydiales bacterium]|nr:hypothetical protein [Parachlamydiales bacterium]